MIVVSFDILFTQLNLKRGIQRRTPEHISSVNKPYDPDKFNFTKVKREEIICSLRPKEDEVEHPPVTESGSAVNGAGNEKGPEVIASNGDRSKTDNGRHVILINVSPLGYGHALVVCDVNDQIYQVCKQVYRSQTFQGKLCYWFISHCLLMQIVSFQNPVFDL